MGTCYIGHVPRPRFHKLPAPKQRQILDVASEEFARSGLRAASFNTIIERSGVSKGAMYYYFDGKEDLYLTVMGEALSGAHGVLSGEIEVTDVEQYWASMVAMWGSVTTTLDEHPTALPLLRDFVAEANRPDAPESLRAAYSELMHHAEAWVHHGRDIGAIRQDLPPDLLMSILMAVGEKMDLWLLDNYETVGGEQLERLMPRLMGLFRRIAEPPY